MAAPVKMAASIKGKTGPLSVEESIAGLQTSAVDKGGKVHQFAVVRSDFQQFYFPRPADDTHILGDGPPRFGCLIGTFRYNLGSAYADAFGHGFRFLLKPAKRARPGPHTVNKIADSPDPLIPANLTVIFFQFWRSTGKAGKK
jgi:hypothetical protein